MELDAVARYLDKIREKNRTIIMIDYTAGFEEYFSQWIQIEILDNLLCGKILK